jgi:carbamate kinase
MKHNWKTLGVDAVIDKDLASERLATSIGASKLVLLTNVDGIYRNYEKKNQEFIHTVNVDMNFEQKLGLRDLESGSIGPKVQAAISFIRNGGKEAIVCSLQHLSDALAGLSGTHFFR